MIPVRFRSWIGALQKKLVTVIWALWTDKVSQYVAADTYTQLTVDGKPYRVTPLEYADPIKWFNNQSKGIGEYIKVDMVTGNAELVDLKTPMKYSDSSILTVTSNAIFGLSIRPRF